MTSTIHPHHMGNPGLENLLTEEELERISTAMDAGYGMRGEQWSSFGGRWRSEIGVFEKVVK